MSEWQATTDVEHSSFPRSNTTAVFHTILTLWDKLGVIVRHVHVVAHQVKRNEIQRGGQEVRSRRDVNRMKTRRIKRCLCCAAEKDRASERHNAHRKNSLINLNAHASPNGNRVLFLLFGLVNKVDERGMREMTTMSVARRAQMERPGTRRDSRPYPVCLLNSCCLYRCTLIGRAKYCNPSDKQIKRHSLFMQRKVFISASVHTCRFSGLTGMMGGKGTMGGKGEEGMGKGSGTAEHSDMSAKDKKKASCERRPKHRCAARVPQGREGRWEHSLTRECLRLLNSRCAS